MRILKARRTFKKEFKRQIKYAITAAVGFTIAFSWREAILNSSKEIITKFVDNAKDALVGIYTALFLTILGVIVILITSRLLRD